MSMKDFIFRFDGRGNHHTTNVGVYRKAYLCLAVLLASIATSVSAKVLVGTLPGDVSVDNSGQASYSIPLSAAPGTADVQPTLAISYSSQGGNGAMGVGFSLKGLSSISRAPSDQIHDGLIDGMDFDEYDRLLLDGQRLLLVSADKVYGEDGSEYRTEIDSFSKIVLHGDMNSSGSWFEVKTKSGLVYEYGHTADSFVEPSNRAQAVSWVVNRISDTAGNYMDYVYDEDRNNGEHLINQIRYTGNDAASLGPYNTVDFVYESRQDTRFRYSQGARFNTTKRLEAIKFNVESNLVYEYQLAYNYSSDGSSQLASVQQFFANGDSLPATLFKWSESAGTRFAFASEYAPSVDITSSTGVDQGVRFEDLNADGLVDMVYNNDSISGAYTNSGDGWVEDSSFTPPINVVDSDGNFNGVQLLDINGDGLVDLHFAAWHGSQESSDVGVYTNNGSAWVDATGLPFWPRFWIMAGNREFGSGLLDLNADGLLDWVSSVLVDGELTMTNAYFGSTTGWVEAVEYTPKYSLYEWYDKSHGVRFLDVNGDALPDMLYHRTNGDKGAYLNTGTNWTASSMVAYEPPYPLFDDTEKDLGVQLEDVNGDGLPDFLYNRKLTDGTVEAGAYLNTGLGWSSISSTNFVPPLVLKEDGESASGVQWVDINDDGLKDIVYHNDTGKGAYLSTGNGWKQDDTYAPPAKIVDQDGHDLGSRFVDVDGDGLVDQVYSCGSESGAYINKTRRPGQLTQVITGYRSPARYNTSTELFYRPLTDKSVYTKGSGAKYPCMDVQMPMYVVSAMAKDNGLGNRYYTMYTYANARTHRYRGFLGFQIFESYDPQTQTLQVETLSQDFPLIGAQLKTETRYVPEPESDPEGQLLKEIDNIYLFDKVDVGHALSDSPLFYYVAKSTERKWELGNTNDVVSEVNTYNWFDNQIATNETPNLVQYTTNFPTEIQYGNISKIVIDYGEGAKQVSENTYCAVDTNNWLLGRLAESQMTHIKPDYPDVVRHASFAYYSGSGLLATEVVETNTAVELKTDYLYDAFGNITNKIVQGYGVAPRSVQRSVYDDKGRFVVESQNALGHHENTVTDPAMGLVTSKTGPNGLTTSWEYDSMGRVLEETRADGTKTTTSYDWEYGTAVTLPLVSGGGPSITHVAEYSITTESDGSASGKTYFDRQGREIRKVAETPSGKKVYQDTGYNTIGQVVAVSDNYFVGETPVFGFSQYDELGRPQVAIAPDGTKTAYGYNGLVSSITNNYDAVDGALESRNQVTTTYKNAKGEVLKVVDNMGYTIEYDYDAIGNLVKTTDELGNEVVMQYDLLGKKVRQDDPDMGEWFYAYNALGELVSQTNANGQVTSMEYDVLGRTVKRTSPEGVARWFYDGAGEGCWQGSLRREELRNKDGLLTYRRTYAYDELGRPMLTLYNIDNKWYYTCTTYDEFSRPKFNYRFWRPKDLAGPENSLSPKWNSFVSINTYNERGAITKVSDASGHVWWQCDEHDFDAKGHLLEYRYGNGVRTSNTYDPLTGFLTRSEARSAGATANDILDRAYGFDRLGNLTSRRDYRHGMSSLQEAFTYDELNRLRTSTMGSSVSSTTYDAIGNIQTKTGVSGTYQYGTGSAGPHAVAAADGITYTYDNCGNMLGRYAGGTNISSTAWTSFNKPSTMYNKVDGSEFTYDINNSRITQISFKDGKGTKKLYLGGFEQEEELVGEQFDRVHWQWKHKLTRVYVSTPSGVVGVWVQTGTDTIARKYFHYDHLGSVVAVSGKKNTATDVAPLLAEYSYDAWGALRNPSDWSPLSGGASASTTMAANRGFTGHEMLDNLGLVHMNGRIYDSHLGRFLSADPMVQAPGDLQSYNRYSYVRNNPLTNIDPSGFSWISKAWKKIVDFHKKWWKVIVVTVIAVVVTVVTLGAATPIVGAFWASVWAGAYAGFAAGFTMTMLNGGNLADAFREGMQGAVEGAWSGALGGGVAKYAQMGLEHVKQIADYAAQLAQGVRGGVVALAKGDNIEAGFLSGLAGASTGGLDAYGLDVAMGALIGGTASVIAGGKFINGAVTGAAAAIAVRATVGLLTPQGPRGPWPTSRPNDDSLVDYLKAFWRWWGGDEVKSDWNPTGIALVRRSGKLGGYVLAGGEAGRITLEFKNGYFQDYGFVGGGIGIGGLTLGYDVVGIAYGVYKPSDFSGYFINVDLSLVGGSGSLSYWRDVASVSGGAGLANLKRGKVTPGLSGAFQGYWEIGEPYK